MSLLIDNITKTYTNGKKADKSVLTNINLNIKQGVFASIVGPSGSGKSTLINIITGLDKATYGDIYIEDKKINSPGAERALIFQENSLFPWLNVIENIEFGMKAKGIKKAERREKALHYLNMVKLLGYENYYIHQLSGGMRQRVSIARALALESEILLMDEPFVSLDSQTRSVLHSELLRIWQESKKTILFITHDIEEAVLLSDKVILFGYSPNNIKDIIDIKLDRPRKNTTEFNEYTNKIKKFIDGCSAYEI